MQGHHLNKLDSTRASNASYQVSRSSAFWFQRRRLFKVFTIYGHGGHRGHVIWTIWTNFRFPNQGRTIWNLASIGPVFSEEKTFENGDSTSYTHTHRYGPGAVARSEASPLGMQAAPSWIPTSGTFFRGDLVMKTFLRPFSLFRWFKKSSCQLLTKECALSTGKLPKRLAQEQCG